MAELGKLPIQIGAVRGAVEVAERMAGEHVSGVIVAVPGKHVRGRRIGVDLALRPALAGGLPRMSVVQQQAQRGAVQLPKVDEVAGLSHRTIPIPASPANAGAQIHPGIKRA